MNEFNSTYNDQNIGNENLSAFVSAVSEELRKKQGNRQSNILLFQRKVSRSVRIRMESNLVRKSTADRQ